VKEGVQFWYNDTFTVRGGWGGVGENVPLENLWSLRYFMSVSVPSSFEIFQTRLALWICAAMLLYLINYDIFIQPGTPSKKMSNYNNNENWSYFVSDIVIYFGKLLKIISRFPQNLGVQRRPFFVLGASQDARTPFWLKAWMSATQWSECSIFCSLFWKFHRSPCHLACEWQPPKTRQSGGCCCMAGYMPPFAIVMWCKGQT
jgi:hypothetical protein